MPWKLPLDTGEIRGLPEGKLLVFYKGLDPMLVQMTAYFRRTDRKELAAGRAQVERAIADGQHPGTGLTASSKLTGTAA